MTMNSLWLLWLFWEEWTSFRKALRTFETVYTDCDWLKERDWKGKFALPCFHRAPPVSNFSQRVCVLTFLVNVECSCLVMCAFMFLGWNFQKTRSLSLHAWRGLPSPPLYVTSREGFARWPASSKEMLSGLHESSSSVAANPKESFGKAFYVCQK